MRWYREALLGSACWAPEGQGGGGLLSSATPAEGEKTTADPAGDKPTLIGDANTPHPATTQTTDPATTADPAKQVQKPARPDWLLEQHWDPEKGEPRLEALAKSHKDAVAEIGKLKQGREAPPDKVDGYLEGFKVPQPRGEDGKFQTLDRLGEIQPDDPALRAFAEIALEEKLPKSVFDRVVGRFLTSVNGLLPEPFDYKREVDLLGGEDKAKPMITATRAWLDTMKTRGILNEDEHAFALNFGDTAIGVRTLAKLREAAGEDPIPLGAPVTTGTPTKEEAYAMLADPLYNDPGPKGAAYRAKVEKVFAETFGSQPASSSAQLRAGAA